MESDIEKQIIDFLEKRKDEKARIYMEKKNSETRNQYRDLPYYCSYCNLLTKLAEDIKSDECMPEKDKLTAMNTIREVNRLLWKYSN